MKQSTEEASELFLRAYTQTREELSLPLCANMWTNYTNSTVQGNRRRGLEVQSKDGKVPPRDRPILTYRP
jgi:hypothetical protein